MIRISIADTKNMDTFRRKINAALDEIGVGPSLELDGGDVEGSDESIEVDGGEIA